MISTTLARPVRNAAMPVAAALACLLLVGCAETPQSSFEQLVKDAESGQYDKVWDRIDKRSQGRNEGKMKLAAAAIALKATLTGDRQKAEELKDLEGKALFVKILQSEEIARKGFVNQRVLSSEVSGDRATLRVKNTETEQERTVTMTREDGVWKLVVD